MLCLIVIASLHDISLTGTQGVFSLLIVSVIVWWTACVVTSGLSFLDLKTPSLFCYLFQSLSVYRITELEVQCTMLSGHTILASMSF